ncbi:MAG: hypothetical protein KF716_03275 [Anaerolineae bacterium]|nr:hypothetical protein [Anaerolineae bacterium]
MRTINRFFKALCCLSFFCLLLPTHTVRADASADAYTWLFSQQQGSGLLESFAVTSPNSLNDVAFTYDQSLAVIAFLLRNDTTNAGRVLACLKRLQVNKTWYTAYTSLAQCNDSVKPTVWEFNRFVGPVVWVALAVGYFEYRTGDMTYHTMALDALDWAYSYQQTDGGINGGLQGATAVTWASTEHNEDAWAASAYFRSAHCENASLVKRFLDNDVWINAPSNQHWMGGRGDAADPLDVNTWGVSALGANGRRPYANSLDYIMAHHRNTQTAGVTVDAFDFNSDHNDIWFEGTFQAVVALRLAGRSADADHFYAEALKGQHLSGGVPYSLLGTHNGYFQMTNYESVSSTAWLIFAAMNFNPLGIGSLLPENNTIGIFRQSTATFYLRNCNSTGFADSSVTFGASTDFPITGDWNGDGSDTPGVYRTSTGQFFLTDSVTNPAVLQYSFVLGNPSDQPIVGDWDGDGKDGVGVFRPSNGLIYLKNNLTTGFADFTMVLGVPGDVGIAGDWNGDGKDSPGVYRPSNQQFYLTNSICNCSVFADAQLGLGIAGDTPFVGDWDGDGKSGVGVYRQSNGLTYIKNALMTGFADTSFVFGSASDYPLAGHWVGKTAPLPAAPALEAAPPFQP